MENRPGGSRKGSRMTPGGLRETLRHASVTSARSCSLTVLCVIVVLTTFGLILRPGRNPKIHRKLTFCERGGAEEHGRGSLAQDFVRAFQKDSNRAPSSRRSDGGEREKATGAVPQEEKGQRSGGAATGIGAATGLLPRLEEDRRELGPKERPPQLAIRGRHSSIVSLAPSFLCSLSLFY